MMTLPSLQPHAKQASTQDVDHAQPYQRQILFQQATLVWSQRSDREQLAIWQQDFLLYKEVVLELRATPPLGLTFDLFALWRQGFQFVPRVLPPAERGLLRSFLRIQNEVYYRLLRMPVFQRLHRQWLTIASTATTSSALAPTSAAHGGQRSALSLADKALVFLTVALLRPVTALLLDSFRPHDLFAPTTEPSDAGRMRENIWEKHLQVSVEPADVEFAPAWVVDPWGCIERFETNTALPGWLASYHDTWVNTWTRASSLEKSLAAQESMIQHMEYLHTSLQRIQWQQLHTVLQDMPPATHLHQLLALRDLGYQTWSLPASHVRTEGGYSGLSRRGEWESLLPSEWLFWDELSSPNPFWVRWAEHESLFYEREQSESLTRHRHLCFFLDLDPGEIRYKTPTLPAPGYALVFALLARICLDLRRVCSTEALSFSFHLSPAQSWDKDASLFALFFETLPFVGASTRFSLVASAQRWRDIVPSSPFQLVYVGTPSRWNPVASSEHWPKTRLVLLAGTNVPAWSESPLLSFSLEQDESIWANLVFLQERMLEWILSSPLTEV